MSAVFNLAQAQGWFKELYGEANYLIPDSVKLMKMIKFNKQKRIGKSYENVVVVTQSHGVTYLGTDGDAASYEAPIASSTKGVSIVSSEMVLRDRIALGVISRSEVGDAASFGKVTKHVLRSLLESSNRKLEAQILYGGSGLATISATLVNVFTVTPGQWAGGIFIAAENMRLQIYSAAGILRGACKIVKVNMADKKIEVDVMPAGVVATDVVYEYGAKGKEFLGIHKILSTTIGTMFGLSVEDYSIWQANQYNVGGALTYDKISEAIGMAVAKGLDGKLTLLVNPVRWAQLLTEQTASRKFDYKYDNKKYENGSEAIEFYSQNGMIEIMASPFIKEGDAFAISLDCFERIGSQELTFKMPGQSESQFMQVTQDAHSVEFRTYTDQALFCSAIGKNIYFFGIS